MRSLLTRALAVTATALAVGAGLAAPAVHAADASYKVLVFSKTAAFRHDSIPAGIQAVRTLGAANNFTVTATEDAAAFTTTNLAQYQAVVFMSTTGDVLNATQQAAFESYIRAGGGYVGVHSASDTEYAWPWYGKLVGAYFKQHPAQQNALLKVEDPNHPSTQGLPAQFTRFDEWYDFQTNPRGAVHVLTSVDNSSYSGSTMGNDHPITWCQKYDGGRSWYTGLGHTIESYSEPNFLHLLLGGIMTAAGAVTADCSVAATGRIPQAQLRVRSCDSQELSGENAPCTNVLDGNAGTFWHTQWSGANPTPPHEIQLDLGASYSVTNLYYLPRQSGTNGRIARYEVYVSTDGTTWGTAVATGTFPNVSTERTVTFTGKSGRYVRLRALSEVNGNPWTSVAELNVGGTTTLH
ncbi:hypothetical protein Lfu02_68680 [Longispora fulva]|uniref:Type 1 glutamine amidotransferase n=1 Tax=Longispora fulva TaxID=619741 RepID=A0A8J7GE89_9ACTN|nr:type 1 glutamine amidotransferase [Longispora fulva]GIG62496.1 hypothetical protein Lfu02_68680 [Longispora fulva]